MRTKLLSIVLMILLLSSYFNLSKQTLMASTYMVGTMSLESDAVIVAWSLPSLISERSTQTATWCVNAAYTASRWSRRAIGTLTWSSAGTVSYLPTPTNRLRVNYANGRTIDFEITTLQGYFNEGPDEFLKNNYQLSCRGIEKDQTDLTMNVTRTNRTTASTATGTIVYAGSTYQVNVQEESNTFFDSDSGGAEYRTNTIQQGTVIGSDFELTINENLSFQLMSYQGESASHSYRSTNNQWRVAGQRYAFENGVFARSYTNGRPAHLDTEWQATGVIRRNNQRWSVLSSRESNSFFEVWATLPNGSIQLVAIRIV